ncbi:hypothetical protein [Mycoplasmopsis gallopavonis]|uniref:Uncharacterized protein n=1 Tax=Mycoplasmopsis gallopavonis TaxID=76629 RepID=A0A449AYL7_9BACT|nr:hypothetical protein [Mycoplasmopsis gallopavonis]RIV16224.1 hypothetical protein D1113_03140 [Mycoplasmopsis gallopavonis]VEU72623.1 Uncharacterised protein [Mycoplasmopsis gallopavonis]VEU72984.1 Uncharacterised protein [Mycoplasmopsis gallopavonis]
MANLLKGICDSCKKPYEYLYGDIELTIQLKFFLNTISSKQINLLDKTKFDNFYRNYIEQQMSQMGEFSEERINKTLDNLYQDILSALTSEEQELLKRNILMDSLVTIVPMYDQTKVGTDEAKVIFSQFLRLNFLGGKTYQREFKNHQIITTSEDQRFMLCPKEETHTVRILFEEKI